ncbi:tropomodulin isoform X2 [Nasonia vitripennis]|uniref:Tropomodulin n=1 Tax=Nasonia vitripennis TaxID=7425 RepID=A0A7M7TCE5_NASVI|nr:tropomodulin isoform X2 [Nasonia vitripennis]XP_031777625.1 tropomodulin isoform X2 [Nasonia vitripennis]XP_032453257.1 tropomodulin isoform X2 [Nasonia vitripennis]
MATTEVFQDWDSPHDSITSISRKTTRKTTKTTSRREIYEDDNDETSASKKTTTMTTAAKLYGKDLSEYDDVDVDELLAQLTPEEINILAKEVDPDDSFMPPSQRCSYECDKTPTGPLNRKKLIEHINKQALETPDIPELKPYVPGVIRGKKWVPPVRENLKEKEADEQIAIDLGDEYEQALTNASEDEIIDLAAILGFHSMMNQDQYHASLLNSGQPVGLGWDGVTKASQPKVYPMEPPNDTDVDETIKRVREDDHSLLDVNWNNIKNISDEKFFQLFEALESNTHLETLSLTNTGLTDKTAQRLAEAMEKNSTLRVLNVETNFISPPVIVKLVRALLKTKSIEEFRCSNQRSQVLGNKIEMEITQLVEQNPTLLRLGLHLEFNDARHRVAAHLQRNIDRICRLEVLLRKQKELEAASLGGNVGGFIGGGAPGAALGVAPGPVSPAVAPTDRA